MFERFTARSRRAIVLAQEEARQLNHNYIGTEHLLLGLLADPEGDAARTLQSLNITLEAAREQVRDIIGEGVAPQSGHIPFTPRAKKVLELSLREALTLRSQSIGSVHLLLGLVAEGEGAGVTIIERLGASLTAVRERAVELAGSEPDPAPGLTEASLPAAPLQRPRPRLRVEGLGAVQDTLIKIEQRLARIEKHLGIAPDVPEGTAASGSPSESGEPSEDEPADPPPPPAAAE
jgi:ATP-dependent Clp protease ATP-binding subunit ClpA